MKSKLFPVSVFVSNIGQFSNVKRIKLRDMKGLKMDLIIIFFRELALDFLEKQV